MQSYSRIVGVPGVERFGLIEPGIYRSARPNELGYHALRDILGFRSVLSFGTSDQELVETVGMTWLEHPLVELKVIHPQEMAIIQQMIIGAPKPVLLR